VTPSDFSGRPGPGPGRGAGWSRMPSASRHHHRVLPKFSLQATAVADVETSPVVFALQTDESANEAATLDDLLQPGTNKSELIARPPSNGPLPVDITVTVSDLFDISEKQSTFWLEGQVVLQWKDRRLAMPAGLTRVQMTDADSRLLWTPQIDFYNEVGQLEIPARKLSLLGATGHSLLTQTMRFSGKFAMRMNFVYYPGDKHALPVEIEIFGNPTSAAFLNSSAVNMITGAVASSLWDSDKLETQIDDIVKPSTGLTYSRLTVHIDLARNIEAYAINLYLPLFIILCLTYLTFYIDPRSVPARGAMCVLATLTAYTFYNTVTENMPETGYVTYTDVSCILAIFGGIISLLSYARIHWLLRQAGDKSTRPIDGSYYTNIDYRDRAERSDASCRCLFPVYILVIMSLSLGPIFRSTQDWYDEGDIL